MSIDTDILIVGGGPAGVSAAIAAEKFGFRSIIIEREKMPRDKICGDGILIKETSNILDKLGIQIRDIVKQHPHKITPKFVIQSPAGDMIKYDAESIIMRRLDFDYLLWENVDQNRKYDEIKDLTIRKLDNDKYISFYSIQEVKYQLTSSYVIAADGYSSYVRRFFFPSLKFESRIATRYYMSLPKGKSSETIMMFDKKISPGYFWCFQLGDRVFNTGVYLPNDKYNPFEIHSYYLRELYNHELDKTQLGTWPIPYNVNFEHLVSGKVILTGDAAGLCDKMFGHGIDNAITSGYLAVTSIYDSLRSDIPYPLGEIYRFKINQYLGCQLKESFDLFDNSIDNQEAMMKKMKDFFINT